MIKFKDLKEAGGAGDWGTDKARKKLQQDTPGQGITDIGVKNKERKESVEFADLVWESLDELDSKTYRSYVDKATADQIKRMGKKKQSDKDKQTMRRRSLGIATAQGKQYGDKRSTSQRIRGEEVELDEATDFRSGDTVYQVGSKLRGKVLHKGNRDQIVVKFGSITKSIPASELRLAESVELSEKLKVSDGLGAWIDDFMKSDAPQFKNADDKKRRDMAIAAFTSAGGKLDESVISIEEGAVALSTVEKEIRSNGGKIVKKDDRSITFTLNGAQRKVPVDRGHVLDTYYMQLQKMFEEVEYVSEDGQWGVKNVYLKYTPDVLKLKKIKIQDTISNLKRQHSSLTALGGKNPRAEEIKELEGKLRMIDQAMRTKKESLDLDEADTYAIYKKGKVFDTFRSKEDAHDSLDSMGLSAISKKDYSVRKLPANYKSNWSMKEEVELDEGTLAASDGSVVDALLTAVKQKLMKDLSSGNVDDANEIAKMVKMTIEKDYKRKGHSRLKR